MDPSGSSALPLGCGADHVLNMTTRDAGVGDVSCAGSGSGMNGKHVPNEICAHTPGFSGGVCDAIDRAAQRRSANYEYKWIGFYSFTGVSREHDPR